MAILSKSAINEIVNKTIDFDLLQQAIQRAVTTRIIEQIEKEIGNSSALRALIRGAMINFVNSQDFGSILIASLKQKVNSLDPE